MSLFIKDNQRERTWHTEFYISIFGPYYVEKTLKEHFPTAIIAIYSHEKEPEFKQIMIKFDSDADEALFIFTKENLNL